jgi:hypothetical protein
MSDKFDKLQAKVVAIMCEWRPPAAAAIQRGVFGAMGQLTEALGADHSDDVASAIAFHLSDWNWDAAFLVAVHLQPDSFTAEEIRTGVGLMLIHAPEHLAEAARLAGHPVKGIFREDGVSPADRESRSG